MATRLFSPAGQQCFVAVKTLKRGDGDDAGFDPSSPLRTTATTVAATATATATATVAAAEAASSSQLQEGGSAGTAEAKLHAANERDFLNEMALMRRLNHPHVVTLLGVCTRARPYLMVLEYLPGGSLDEWLPENGRAAHPVGLVGILHQVASAFVALGDVGIVHRDLAARNVLIDERLVALFPPSTGANFINGALARTCTWLHAQQLGGHAAALTTVRGSLQ
jgi:serine/threonine protein kinase